jgi:HEAT repeat protein
MKVEDLIHNLISDDQQKRDSVLTKISLFSQGGSPEFKSFEKIELISHFRILNDHDLFKVCSKLINSKNKGILLATIHQIELYLSRNKRESFLHILLEHQRLFKYAIALVKAWKSRHYADLLVPLLKVAKPKTLGLIVDTLSDIALNAYLSRIIHLISHENDELRITVAENVNFKGDEKVPPTFIDSCLKDTQSKVRLAGLQGLSKQINKKWISNLSVFLEENSTQENECAEVLRLLSQINHKKVIPILVNFLFKTDIQALRWSCYQALDGIDQKYRIDYYKQLLYNSDERIRPQVFELIGHCEGKSTFLLLKRALKDFDDPGSRSLIAGALGTCEYPESEQILLEMMELGVAEAYGAASALKNIAKSKVMDHFEHFLLKESLDVLVKQIILQHISEGAQSMSVPPSLIKIIEDFLHHENDNIRYLALMALKSIASPSCIPALLKISKESWLTMFRKDWQNTISNCSNGFLNPLLKLITDTDKDTLAFAIEFIKEKPLILKEEDLNLLQNTKSFDDWKWDEDLLHCIDISHKYDKSLIWRMFSKKDLQDKMCCFIARGFDQAGPHIKELLDPIILVKCFSRFHSEKPLLLLAKLMSNFPSIQLLPPLIQYSENADSETQSIFRAFVRKMILNMGGNETT